MKGECLDMEDTNKDFAQTKQPIKKTGVPPGGLTWTEMDDTITSIGSHLDLQSELEHENKTESKPFP